jgi:hypothetical protein
MFPSWRTAQAQLAHAHTQFQEAAAAVPPHLWEQAGVCGDWTPRQVAAHLAGWDREAARALHALLAGAPEEFVTDVDAFNAASVAARAHLSWAGTCGEVYQAHEALMQAIDTLIVADLPAPGYRTWMDGRVADYALHTAHLRAWLPPETLPAPLDDGATHA